MLKLFVRSNNNQGAASVLVVLVMIALITLGLLAMVFANSNYKLSQKTLAAEKEYYLLDSQAESVLGEVDALLIAAQNSSQNDTDAYRRSAVDALIKWAKENPEYSASYFTPALLSSAPVNDLDGYLQFTVFSGDSSLEVKLKPQLVTGDPSIRFDILAWNKTGKVFEYENLDEIIID